MAKYTLPNGQPQTWKAYGVTYTGSHYPPDVGGVLCENCGKSWAYHAGVNCLHPFIGTAVAAHQVLTQKARGIFWCIHNAHMPGLAAPLYNITLVDNNKLRTLCTDIRAGLDIYNEAAATYSASAIFARPCPMRPRHGFVDSRVVVDAQHLRQVAEETLTADADSELILCGKVDAQYSAVATVSNITYGQGNDGATSGRNAITVPYPTWGGGSLIATNVPSACKPSVITESPYIELLWHKHVQTAIVCQLRDGPAPLVTLDYIPRTVEVTRVLETCDSDGNELSLLAWEQLITSVKDEAGVVVNHVDGSLTSHYAVHCIINNVPVLCSRAPIVGEVLRTHQAQDKLPINYARLAVHLDKAFTLITELHESKTENNVYLATIGCSYLHAQTLWDGSDNLLKLRAYGIAATLSCLYAALIGEARHANDEFLVDVWKEDAHMLAGAYAKENRATIFERTFKLTIPQLARFYPKLYRTYSEYQWDPNYGGMAWLNCTQATQSFFNAAACFIGVPCEDNFKEVLQHWNRAINTIHNGGTPISKMNNSSNILGFVLSVPARAFLSNMTPTILFDGRFAVAKDAAVTVETQADITALQNLLVTTTPGTFTKEIAAAVTIAISEAARLRIYIERNQDSVKKAAVLYDQTFGKLPIAIIKDVLTNSNDGRLKYLYTFPATLEYTVTRDHEITARVMFTCNDFVARRELSITRILKAYLLDLISVRQMNAHERSVLFKQYSFNSNYTPIMLPVAAEHEEEQTQEEEE